MCLIVNSHLSAQLPRKGVRCCLGSWQGWMYMDESADASRILTAVLQSDWKSLAGRPHTS